MKFEGVVSAKRDYEGELTHLKVHPVREGEALPPEARTRDEVIQDIQTRDYVYYTGEPNEHGLKLIARLRVVETKTGTALRTDQEQRDEDSLPELPKF
jgi:hypothetical protein